MQRSRSNPYRRLPRFPLVHSHGSSAFGGFRRVIIALGIACALVALPLTAVSAADAVNSAGAGVERTPFFIPNSTPTPAPSPSDEPRRGLITSPATTIETSPAGFTPTGTAAISGTRSTGSSVTVELSGGTVICQVPGGPSISWSCGRVPLPDGAGLTLDARETPSDPQADVPATGSVVVDSLAPPTVDGPFDQLTTGIVSGTGRVGSTVAVSVEGAIDSSCGAVPVGSDSSWSCNLAALGGRSKLVRAQQSDIGIGSGSPTAYSNAILVTIDREPADTPVISSPASGSTVVIGALVVAGSGEDAASIDLYVDNVPACSAVVSGTAWTCTVTMLRPGLHDVQAVQRDEAGNFSSPSSAIRVTAEMAASSGPLAPLPPPNTGSTDRPTSAVPPGSATPSMPDPLTSEAPSNFAAPPASPPAINWDAPTDFGSTLTSFANPTTFSNWYTAPLIALVFLSLIALPLRLLLTTLRERLPARKTQFSGRNQAPHRPKDEPDKPPQALWKRMLLPLTAIAVLVIFTGGIDGEVRYIRLLVAVAIGLAVLNVAGAALGARLGATLAKAPTTMRFVPLMFVAAAATAILSRTLQIDPPLIAGVLVAPAFALGVAVRGRATVNMVQVAAVLGLGVLGWIGHGALAAAGITSGAVPSATGLLPAIASETLATLCLAGLGSALVMVLPIASLPGRVIFEWSPLAWVSTVLVVASVAAAITVSAEVSTSLVPLILGALGFAAVSVSVWAWVRYVEPATT